MTILEVSERLIHVVFVLVVDGVVDVVIVIDLIVVGIVGVVHVIVDDDVVAQIVADVPGGELLKVKMISG